MKKLLNYLHKRNQKISISQIIFLTAFVLFITCNPIFAQTCKLSLKEAVLGKTSTLAPNTLHQLRWRPGSNRMYSYVKDNILIGETMKSRKQINLLSLDKLKELPALSNLQVLPMMNWASPNEVCFSANHTYWIYNVITNQIALEIKYPEEAASFDYSDQAKALAYTKKNNLFIAKSGKVLQLSKEPNNAILYGSSVHREEFGITKGTFWSPQGNLLAFYRMDETMVKDYPLVNYMAPEAEVKLIKYPMAGDRSHQVKVGVYDLKTHASIYLKTGEPDDHYLTNLSWTPDEKNIILLELNREQNHLKMNLYNAHTGDFIRTILEEKSKTYVEPLHPLLFSKTESGTFFYQSRKDGYNHIYKCSIDGSFMKQLTHGNWEVTNLLGLDSKEQYMYLESTQESPLERHIYRFDLKNGQSVRLTNGEGIHNGLLSPNKDALLDKFQGPAIPNRITLIDTRNKKECMILNAENPLKDYLLGETRLVTIKSADGKTDLYAKMILPPNFDPKKKYPVIVYVYGGPHSQLVDKSWLYNGMFWQYYMADRGYIAFTLDNRGTSFRGSDFENVIHRQLGINETADQMQGVEYLKSLPYVDSTRIGVHGWSFGGFMTLNLMLRHSETFKVGVAGGPVVDWKMYEIMYGERYMDMPQENPEGYKESNMILKVDNLKGKLLLLHGMQDETVVMQQNIRFMQECIKKGKLVDFFPYPTHEHNVKGIDRVHLMDLVSHYFEEHL